MHNNGYQVHVSVWRWKRNTDGNARKENPGHRQNIDTLTIKFEETQAWQISGDSETRIHAVSSPTTKFWTPNRVSQGSSCVVRAFILKCVISIEYQISKGNYQRRPPMNVGWRCKKGKIAVMFVQAYICSSEQWLQHGIMYNCLHEYSSRFSSKTSSQIRWLQGVGHKCVYLSHSSLKND